MRDSVYDLKGTETADLRKDLEHLRRVKGNMRVSNGPSARKFQDITQDIDDIVEELKRRGASFV